MRDKHRGLRKGLLSEPPPLTVEPSRRRKFGCPRLSEACISGISARFNPGFPFGFTRRKPSPFCPGQSLRFWEASLGRHRVTTARVVCRDTYTLTLTTTLLTFYPRFPDDGARSLGLRPRTASAHPPGGPWALGGHRVLVSEAGFARVRALRLPLSYTSFLLIWPLEPPKYQNTSFVWYKARLRKK